MTEQQYLSELERQLQKLRPQEIADILRDFEEYFENGQAEGKATAQIIEALGSPADIAKELLMAYDEKDFVEPISLDKKVLGVNTPYRNVHIAIENANVRIVPTEQPQAYLDIHDSEMQTKATLKIEQDTLYIDIKKQEKMLKILFVRITSNTKISDVTVYLPQKQYNRLSANSDNGYIEVNDLDVHVLELETENGRIILNRIKGEQIDTRTDNGRIVMEHIIANGVVAQTDNGRIIAQHGRANTFTFRTDNGRIILDAVDGAIEATTDMGSIEARLEKVNAPISMTTDMGNIQLITPQKLTDVFITGKTDMGSVNIYKQAINRYTAGTAQYKVALTTDMGSIMVDTAS